MDEAKTRKAKINEEAPLRQPVPIGAELARPHPEDAALAERAEAEPEMKPEETAAAESAAGNKPTKKNSDLKRRRSRAGAPGS